jgi:decaprenylphospho-beta-D-ribofuranose 2-oxidase
MNTSATTGWGRSTSSNGRVIRPDSAEQWEEAIATAGPRGLIARGGGCAYGDAAQNAGGTVALTSSTNERLEIEDDTVLVDAGTTLGAIVRALAPLGWTLPVVPGTSHVTVGGAIAADVHGKNHVHTGTFGSHVREMSVLTPALGEVVLGPESNPDAFRATVGGLGLTGVITRARLGLIRLDSWFYCTTDTIVDGLDATLESLATAARDSPYAVGWLDARTRTGIISRADPMMPRRAAPPGGGRLPAPRTATPTLLGRGIGTTITIANRARLTAARLHPRATRPLPAVLYPLDALPGWPGLHGPRGLVQYQFVVPFGAEQVLHAALRGPARAATLAVLKVFGAASDAPLSFPMPGWSLALDFPAHPRLASALDTLDEQVAAAGGRVYLVKDSRMRPDLVAAMYPGLDRWRAERDLLDPDRLMTSDLDRRLRLSGDGHA